MWKDEIFAKALLISPWPFLLLWHLHSTCCILLISPLLWKIPPFLNCPTFCPPACSPPEWSHWLPMPPSALNWLGTDPKIPPSQQLLWANREAPPACLQLCPGGDSYPQSTKYGCWAHAWHSPNTQRKLHTQPPRSMDTFTQADYFSVSFFLSLHCF